MANRQVRHILLRDVGLPPEQRTPPPKHRKPISTPRKKIEWVKLSPWSNWDYAQKRRLLGNQATISQLLGITQTTLSRRESQAVRISREMEYAMRWINHLAQNKAIPTETRSERQRRELRERIAKWKKPVWVR